MARFCLDTYQRFFILPTVIILTYGLPGTGKSTLARLAVQKLQIPLLRIDDIVSFIPSHMSRYAHPYWDDMIGILLNLVESQLELGLSVIVDSVFMGEDRYQAAEIARRHKEIVLSLEAGQRFIRRWGEFG